MKGVEGTVLVLPTQPKDGDESLVVCDQYVDILVVCDICGKKNQNPFQCNATNNLDNNFSQLTEHAPIENIKKIDTICNLENAEHAPLKKNCYPLNNTASICHDMSLWVQNVEGLPPYKQVEFHDVVVAGKYDVVGVIEHFKYSVHELPNIPGYTKWAQCRFFKKKGGLAMYVRKEWATAYKLSVPLQAEGIEMLWVQLPKYNIACAVVYIPPKNDDMSCIAINCLQNHVEWIRLQKMHVIIAGDLNIKINLDSHSTSNLINMVEASNLRIANLSNDVMVCTRRPEDGRDNQTPSVLDYIIVSGDLLVRAFEVDIDREKSVHSDHVSLICTVGIKEEESQPPDEPLVTEIWARALYRSATLWKDYQTALDNKDFSLPEGNVQEQYTALASTMHEVGQRIFKKNFIGRKVQLLEPIYIQKAKAKLRNLRKTLRKLKRENKPTYVLQDTIWRQRQNIKQLISNWNTNMIYKNIHKVNDRKQFGIKGLYEYMGKYKKPVREKFLLTNEKKEPLCTFQEIQDALFKQVDSIFQFKFWPEAQPVMDEPSLCIDADSQEFLIEDITQEEVVYAVRNLNRGTSAGPTDIPPELLYNLPVEYIECITQWCQNMWEKEEFPLESHINDMTFLHKKGATDNLKYYRTLATGCNLCKIFAKILTFRMQSVSEDNNLLGNIQTGFRRGHMGTENLFILETVIEKTKREKKNVIIALLDITKAYDRVDREYLWQKLCQYKFPVKFVNILRKMYTGTMCTLKFQGITTNPKEIKLGLKQGCVMSPILFALYIADLGRKLENSGLGVSMGNNVIPGLFFADDMLLWETEKNFQKLLNIVKQYGQKWKIEFSEEKSIVIPILRKPKDKLWSIGYVPDKSQRELFMREYDKGKYLGVLIKRTHNIFKPHIDALEGKIHYASHSVNHIVGPITNIIPVLRDTWNTYVSSTVLYATEALAFAPSQIETLEKAQRQFIKMTLNLPAYTSTNKLCLLVGILPLQYSVFQRRLAFHQTLLKKNHCWPIACLYQQRSWARLDSILDASNNPMPRRKNNLGTSYLLKEIINFIQNDYQRLNRAMLIQEKPLIKFFVHSYFQYVTLSSDNLNVLEVPSRLPDSIYHKHHHKWWLRVRLNAIYLRAWKTKATEQLCPLGCNTQEDLLHFMWDCPHLGDSWIINETPEPVIPTAGGRMTWWFNNNRTDDERRLMNNYVHGRWVKRTHKLEALNVEVED